MSASDNSANVKQAQKANVEERLPKQAERLFVSVDIRLAKESAKAQARQKGKL